ncbi:transcriptional regulatory protein LevR [Clostridium beijerinckii]|nr:transcriptional regulatory protein LevR [Clostridium beijerinckii]
MAFDMHIESSPLDKVIKILGICQNNRYSKGLLILVDMGSLETIYIYWKKKYTRYS